MSSLTLRVISYYLFLARSWTAADEIVHVSNGLGTLVVRECETSGSHHNVTVANQFLKRATHRSTIGEFATCRRKGRGNILIHILRSFDLYFSYHSIILSNINHNCASSSWRNATRSNRCILRYFVIRAPCSRCTNNWTTSMRFCAANETLSSRIWETQGTRIEHCARTSSDWRRRAKRCSLNGRLSSITREV